ncbi:MAG: hypothetical protein ACJ74E_02030 [Actinomycetes bacterium]
MTETCLHGPSVEENGGVDGDDAFLAAIAFHSTPRIATSSQCAQ